MEPEEIAALEQKRHRIVAEMQAARKERLSARIAAHTSSEATRVIDEVKDQSNNVMQHVAQELDKRLGPAPVGAMEEALAERVRANKRIRELRKMQEKMKTLTIAAPPSSETEATCVPASAGAATEGTVSRVVEDAEAIRNGYHKKFITGEVLDALWRYTLTRTPYHVRLRAGPVKSRPKINYGMPNEAGEYGLYRWGQWETDWPLVEDMPAELLAVVEKIHEVFGVRPNHVIATYYHNGKDQWIPVHQDKGVSRGSGFVESQTTTFNLALGAVRPFIVTTLGCLGKKLRQELQIVDEFPMCPGDMYALSGDINNRFGHCVAKDSSIRDLRVSYVFRCVDKHLVHPTLRYYREMDKTGKRVALPQPEAEPKTEGDAMIDNDQPPPAKRARTR